MKFMIDGKEVSIDRIGDEILKASIKEIIDNVTKTLKNLRCPVHGKRADVTIHKTGSKIHFEVRGCCQKLIDLATSKLK